MIAALAVVCHMEQFYGLAVPLTQKLEFLAQRSGHMQQGAVQAGICPGGVGPLDLRTVLRLPVQVAGEHQMDGGNFGGVKPVFDWAAGCQMAVICLRGAVEIMGPVLAVADEVCGVLSRNNRR